MDNKIFDKLTKVNELISRGATDGEKQAAKLAFEKLVEKNGITEEQLKELFETDYKFTYSNLCESILLKHIVAYVLDKYTDDLDRYRYTHTQRAIWYSKLTKLQYIQIVAMNEYFKRHMKIEYKKVVTSAVDHAKKLKKLGYENIKIEKERWWAQVYFIHAYLTKSKIDRYPQKESEALTKGAKEKEEKTKKEKEKYQTSSLDLNSIHNIEGGKYHEQIMSDSRSLDYLPKND